MDAQTEEKKKKKWLRKILRKLVTPAGIVVILIVVALSVVTVGLKTNFWTDGKTTKLGFEDIGELATQSARCTSVRVEGKDRELLGVTIPFTTSKCIYSYDTVIKAGIDFNEVKVSPKADNPKVIYVEIPEIKILSTAVDYDSFKLYHEEESIFAPITMEEHNDAMKELESTAQKDAIDNGLFDNAYENAKVLLTAFLNQAYNPDKYTIEFSEQKEEILNEE